MENNNRPSRKTLEAVANYLNALSLAKKFFDKFNEEIQFPKSTHHFIIDGLIKPLWEYQQIELPKAFEGWYEGKEVPADSIQGSELLQAHYKAMMVVKAIYDEHRQARNN